MHEDHSRITYYVSYKSSSQVASMVFLVLQKRQERLLGALGVPCPLAPSLCIRCSLCPEYPSPESLLSNSSVLFTTQLRPCPSRRLSLSSTESLPSGFQRPMHCEVQRVCLPYPSRQGPG